MKPIIGITTYFVKGSEQGKERVRGFPGQDMLMSTMDYSLAVRKAGGIPIAIPLIQDNSYIEEVLNVVDGVIFAGGADVNPREYGQSYRQGLGLVVPERDTFELKLLDKALQSKKPVLGICRGLQLINVYFGGTLHQDLNGVTTVLHGDAKAPKYSLNHKVKIAASSQAYKAIQLEELYVNSHHHQAIERLGEGLIETGWAEDEIIEAIEHKDYPFVVGVQWHPEMMFEEYPSQLDLFKYFVEFILYSAKKN